MEEISTNWMPSSDYIRIIIFFLTGIILPIILIPVVWLTGNSEIVEEIFKAIVVFLIFSGLSSKSVHIFSGGIFGLAFGFSETMLYTNQILQFGDANVFFERLLWTMPMHVLTVLIMVSTGLIRKKYIFVGLLVAIAIHLCFNFAIVNYT